MLLNETQYSCKVEVDLNQIFLGACPSGPSLQFPLQARGCPLSPLKQPEGLPQQAFKVADARLPPWKKDGQLKAVTVYGD